MALWLDFKIFGGGCGLRSPYFDDVFYWLVDTRGGREGGKGALYNWIGGHGAQLRSRQWWMPRPGERRRLGGRTYVVFNAERRGLRVDVSWALTPAPHDLNEMNALLADVKRDLGVVVTND